MDARGSWVCTIKRNPVGRVDEVTVFGEPVPLVLPVTLGFALHEHHSNIQMTALDLFLTLIICILFSPLSCPVVWCHVLYTLVEICPPILITSVAV